DSLSPWGVVIAGVGNYMTLIMQIVGNCLTVDNSALCLGCSTRGCR
ncbi:hypothetical protein M2271_005654, partial [Streptomyces sp. LBL]|nr:hypothetical protein [Streptomyces sp. LBL]